MYNEGINPFLYNSMAPARNFLMNPAAGMARNTGLLGNAMGARAGGGLFGLFGRGSAGNSLGIINAAKGVNWSTLINNTSRTLGIVKEAVPIVKGAGPMFNNMRTMFKLASAFKDETDIPKKDTIKEGNFENIATKDEKEVIETPKTLEKKESPKVESFVNEPKFFI